MAEEETIDHERLGNCSRKCFESEFDAHFPTNNKTIGSVYILDNVLLPLLRHDISITKKRESNLRSSIHLTYAKKFASRVCKFIHQQEQGIQFVVPNLGEFELDGSENSANIHEVKENQRSEANEGSRESNIQKMIRHNSSCLKTIEKTVSEWNVTLTRCIDVELNKKPRNELPIGEVDFWRRRHVILSDMMEQLKSSRVQNTLDALQEVGSSMSPKISENINTLTKMAVEAADNAKFLSTLERHLRTLNDGTLTSIIAAIPSLVDGMRMVWTVSRHYNHDERMLPFMERIGNQIAVRVKDFVSPQDLLRREDLTSVKEKVQDSKRLLDIWRTSYMSTRERIEEMGTSQRRWEFDRVLLFERTNYMGLICGDLLEVIDSINDFRHFFNPDLQMITGRSDHVNSIVGQIDSLMDIIAASGLDIFDIRNKTEWQEKMSIFKKTVASIEKSAETSIETAFQQLRSSETAYELVVKLKGLKTRQSIHKLIEDRYRDILERYEMELDEAIFFFGHYSNNPPLCRRFRKVPGAITWGNDIYLRIKRTVMLFHNHGDFLSTERGQKVKRKYLQFAKEIDLFKNMTYDDWCMTVKDICQDGLRRPILTRTVLSENDANCSKLTNLSTKASSDEISPSSNGKHKKVSLSISSSSFRSQIATNFSNRVRVAIAEATQFDSMGYKIPISLVHLSLQQHIYDRYLIELEKVVKMYNFICASMSHIEFIVLQEHIEAMDDALRLSFTSLNWSSQGIWGFISKANHAIDTFRSSLTETRKHSKAIENVIISAGRESLVQANIPVSCNRASVNQIDEISTKKAHFLADNLKSIYPLVQKIDLLLSPSKTDWTSLYCAYWEKRLYNALVELILRSLVSALFILEAKIRFSNGPEMDTAGIDGNVFNAVLCMKRIFRTLLTAASQYNRWLAGSCKDAISVNADGNEETFPFLDDLSRDPSLLSFTAALKVQCKRINVKLEESR